MVKVSSIMNLINLILVMILMLKASANVTLSGKHGCTLPGCCITFVYAKDNRRIAIMAKCCPGFTQHGTLCIYESKRKRRYLNTPTMSTDITKYSVKWKSYSASSSTKTNATITTTTTTTTTTSGKIKLMNILTPCLVVLIIIIIVLIYNLRRIRKRMKPNEKKPETVLPGSQHISNRSISSGNNNSGKDNQLNIAGSFHLYTDLELSGMRKSEFMYQSIVRSARVGNYEISAEEICDKNNTRSTKYEIPSLSIKYEIPPDSVDNDGYIEVNGANRFE